MNKEKISAVLFNFGILLVGISLILWADKVTNIVSIVLGCLIVFYGIINIINYFKVKDRVFGDSMHFVYGIFIVVIGSVLIFRVNFLKELVSFIVGIYILLASVIKLYDYFVTKKNNNVKITSSLILSLIGVVIGILCIVGKFLLPDIILNFIGYMLVIYSLVDTSNLIILGKNK